MTRPAVQRAYDMLSSEDEGRVCRDISDAACKVQPGSFLRHAIALGLNKSADGLVDPKLVLSWLMTHLGAPASRMGTRKPIMAAGLGQGVGAAIIALAALTTTGSTAGGLILLGLAVLAVSRSVASVAYKDVLGKTVAKGQRGTVTGLAGTWAAGVALAFALSLIWLAEARFAIVTGALFAAALAWVLAGAVFAGLREDAGATEGGGNGAEAALANLRYLREDRGLARFIVARGLLTATALAPPWFVVLASGNDALQGLGALVLASALAALVSSYVWGRLADRSSRMVLVLTGVSGAASMGLALIFAALGLAGTLWAMPLALFGLMIAHQGVRLGRSTYIVDMAPPERRAVYTAIANTVIGVILLASGVFGALAALGGAELTLALFALMATGGAWVAYGLKELGDG